MPQGLLDTGPSGPLEWPIIPCSHSLNWAIWGLLCDPHLPGAHPKGLDRPEWDSCPGHLFATLVLPVTNTPWPHLGRKSGLCGSVEHLMPPESIPV